MSPLSAVLIGQATGAPIAEPLAPAVKRSGTVVAGTSTAINVREVNRNLIWQKEIFFFSGQTSPDFSIKFKVLKMGRCPV